VAKAMQAISTGQMHAARAHLVFYFMINEIKKIIKVLPIDFVPQSLIVL
jgi:hypothetical protein